MNKLTPQQLDLKLSDLISLYGDRPDKCPEELRGWLDTALATRDLEIKRRENDELEARQRSALTEKNWLAQQFENLFSGGN